MPQHSSVAFSIVLLPVKPLSFQVSAGILYKSDIDQFSFGLIGELIYGHALQGHGLQSNDGQIKDTRGNKC